MTGNTESWSSDYRKIPDYFIKGRILIKKQYDPVAIFPSIQMYLFSSVWKMVLRSWAKMHIRIKFRMLNSTKIYKAFTLPLFTNGMFLSCCLMT